MGGGERVAVHSIKAAVDRGDAVTLVSESFDVELFEEFFGCNGLFNQVQMVTYPEFRVRLNKLTLYRRLLYHQLRQKRALRGCEDFDLLLSTQDIGYVPDVEVPAVQYCQFPEYYSHLESNPFSPWWRLYYSPARRFYRRKINRVETILCNSKYTQGFIKRVWSRDALNIYPPCPTEGYDQASSRENLVVSVGRLVPEKRFEDFLAMARQLPMLQFAIIGNIDKEKISYYNRMSLEKPANLEVLVAPPYKTLRKVLSHSKVYVHCMKNEHFGIAMVEAMAAGCVPVVHDSGGPREIVTHDVGYRWRELSEAIEQISTLMKDEGLRLKLSAAARERAKLFSPEVFESKLSSVLDQYNCQ